MKLYLLRHGQTAYNEKGLVQGTTDTPLSQEGIRQAVKVREKTEELGLVFDRVFSSPLQRALLTGETVCGRSRDTFLVDRRLREIEVGALAGRSILEETEVMTAFMYFPDRYIPLPGGESFPDLVERAGSFLEWIKGEDFPGSTLVCTHGGWMHAARMYLEPRPMRDFWKPSITNCTVFRLETDPDDRWRITDIIENTESGALGF